MSDIRVDTISAANGTDPVTLTKQQAVRAHCSWNTETFTIVETFNVSSITDESTGKSTVNFSNAFASQSQNNTTTCFQRTGTAGGEFSQFVYSQSSATRSVVETFVNTTIQDCFWNSAISIGDLA